MYGIHGAERIPTGASTMLHIWHRVIMPKSTHTTRHATQRSVAHFHIACCGLLCESCLNEKESVYIMVV
jgi:hypothetical protein